MAADTLQKLPTAPTSLTSLPTIITGLSIVFKNKQGFWLSVKIIPAPGYSDAYPYAVLAFEDLTQKVEHSLSEKTAKMAVAHMYALAISVDMEHQGYNCIHYSEEILSLQKSWPLP